MKLDAALLKASWRSWYANDLRVVGPPWLQIVWTFIFGSVVGTCFFLLGVGTMAIGAGKLPSWAVAGKWFFANLVVAWVISACIHLLFATVTPLVGVDRIRNFNNRQKAFFFAGIPLVGTAIGWPLGSFLVANVVNQRSLYPFRSMEAVFGALLLALLISFLFYKHFDAKARQIEAEKRATEAQLRLLQAQIEPHFLFNTLANVQSLIDHDAPRAKQMLAAFTDYLRASLGGLRRDEAPLADELALAQAYLRIQQTRMDERLSFSIEASEETRLLLLPPLLLQPLVENAVHHGLEPQIDGGTVTVRARLEHAQLIVDIRDDGSGMAAAPRKGAGLALSNLRKRLLARFGDAARLELSDGAPGTLARLIIPATALAKQT